MKSKLLPLMLLTCAQVLFAFSLPVTQRETAQRVVGSILNGDFAAALRVTDSSMTADTVEPLAAVLCLAVLGMRDVDFDKTIDSSRFVQTYDRAIARIGLFELHTGVSSYSRTLLGLTKAIHATFYLRIHSYLDALGTGSDALKYLHEAHALDTTNTDVDFFLGLYDYAKSDLKKRLWWVLFWFPGDKQEGIGLLEQCAATAKLTAAAASLSLSDIYLNEKEPRRSCACIERLGALYPQSRFVLWARAKYFANQKLYDRAAETYGQLAQSYEQCPHGEYNALCTLNSQAHMHELAGKKELAIEECRQLIARCSDTTDKIYKDTRKMMERLHGTKS